jgi:hypothetical protein
VIPLNEENLIPFKKGEQRQKDLGKLGGIASGEAKREKKLLKELLEEALSKGTETDNEYINITLALIKQANEGNVKAYEVIRDTLGQKPADKVEHKGSIPVVIDDDIRE